jgi:hypothetical protein
MQHTMFNAPVIKISPAGHRAGSLEILVWKTGGAGPLISLTGDLEKDMNVIRNFYRKVRGKHPEKTSPVVIHP